MTLVSRSKFQRFYLDGLKRFHQETLVWAEFVDRGKSIMIGTMPLRKPVLAEVEDQTVV